MVKLRDARYCNIKVFLLFLVIYGHSIEPEAAHATFLAWQYRAIYLFHMPLFSFLSGLFLHDPASCATQCKKTILIYVLCQSIAVLFGLASLRTPYWHLWYLLSSSAWSGLAWFWFRFYNGKYKILVLALSVIVGCAVGYFSFVGRAYSLSRTIVFFPYFWMGILCNYQYRWEKLRPYACLFMTIAAVILNYKGNQIPVDFLYQASAYSESKPGVLLRLSCYFFGFAIGLFVLSFAPGRRFVFTQAGSNTMAAYLLHAPIVLFLRKLGIPWPLLLLTTGTYLYVVHIVFRWQGTLFGVVPLERRRKWPHFKNSMKNMPGRSTNFCYLSPGMRISQRICFRKPSTRHSGTSTDLKGAVVSTPGFAKLEKMPGSKNVEEQDDL